VKHKWWSIVRRLAGYRRLDFANESQERQQRRELLDIVYVITSLTLSCFILALFYDLQSPVDDDYCGQWTDQASCQTTKTALDPQVNKCSWIAPPEPLTAAILLQSSFINGQVISSSIVSADVSESERESLPCQMHSDTLSSRAFLLAFLIKSMVSLLFMYALDVVFYILHAQSRPFTFANGGLVSSVAFLGALPTSNNGMNVMKSNRLVPEYVIQARSAWTTEQWERQDGREVIAGVEILQEMILWMIKQYDDSLPWEEHVLREEMNRWLPVLRSRS
jgi:hypothetical protein